MSKINLFLAIISLIFLLITGCEDEKQGSKSFWHNIVISQTTTSQQLAIVDLQRYIAQVNGKVSEVSNSHKSDTASILIKIKDDGLIIDNLQIDWQRINNQGYVLYPYMKNGKQSLVIAAKTPIGTVNGIYGLLKQSGFGFYLGSEAVPANLPHTPVKEAVYKNPVFKVRGVLPWYNFFNSPTAWEQIDHRTFVDQLIRSGANFITFHSYDHEPFAAYEQDGKMQYGDALFNTKTPTWGTKSTPVADFGFGTDKLYRNEYFGAMSTLQGLSRDQQIRLEQSILKKALDYAKKRGLYTSLGFSINGDPTNPQERDKFIKQLEYVINYYKSLDYVFLWQRETKGAQGFPLKYNLHTLPDTRDPKSKIVNYGKYRWDIFKRIVEEAKGEKPFWQDNEEGRLSRAIEGARLEMFAKLADRILSRYENAPKVVISGWGGDQRLLSAEYYDGLDKLLDEDVSFASLDHIVPRERVDEVYSILPENRQRWPIPWLEYDGDEWQPQPFVHEYEKMMTNIHQGGSQGFLAIHWRTREVEENFGYMLAYAWDPEITAEKYFHQMAQKLYDQKIADQMAEIHIKLDKMGYRWVGGTGQNECAIFTWGPGEQAKADKLSNIYSAIESIEPQAEKGRHRLNWLMNRIQWVLNYYQAEKTAKEVTSLLKKAEDLQGEELARVAIRAKKLLEKKELAKAMEFYAGRISTRGEYGVLATVNTKAVPALKDLTAKVNQYLDPEDKINIEYIWETNKIVLPRLIGSALQGETLILRPIVIGGKDAWLHYRCAGEEIWKSQKLVCEKGWVYKCQIPAEYMKTPAVKYAFSFSVDPSKPMAHGPAAMTVMPKAEINKSANVKESINVTKRYDLKLKFEKKDEFCVLKWNDFENADYFKVYKNDDLELETVLPFYPVKNSACNGTYKVKAFSDTGQLASDEMEIR